MGKASRTKGVAGEREVARIYEDAGLTVRGLEGSGDHLVLGGVVTLHSETKRQERLQIPAWIKQAASEAPPGTVPVVAFRQNRGEWWACLPLERLATIVRETTP